MSPAGRVVAGPRLRAPNRTDRCAQARPHETRCVNSLQLRQHMTGVIEVPLERGSDLLNQHL
jgi:hypothetical protein